MGRSMTAATLTLTDFLLARIAEDEAVARKAINAGDGVWARSDEHEAYLCIVEGADIRIYDEGGHDEHQAAHIARHDPARVLAECAAKRAIVDEATNQHTGGIEFDGVLRALASIYADHPDFDERWAS